MKIEVKRVAKKDTYTIGKMYINNKYICDVLEDKDRNLTQDMALSTIKRIKVPNNTAIPTGTYKVIVNMSPKFKRLLPRLLDVPGFDGILIHRGNTDKDTSGCLIVGENKVVGKVIKSTVYENMIVNLLKITQDNNEPIEITVS